MTSKNQINDSSGPSRRASMVPSVSPSAKPSVKSDKKPRFTIDSGNLDKESNLKLPKNRLKFGSNSTEKTGTTFNTMRTTSTPGSFRSKVSANNVRSPPTPYPEFSFSGKSETSSSEASKQHRRTSIKRRNAYRRESLAMFYRTFSHIPDSIFKWKWNNRLQRLFLYLGNTFGLYNLIVFPSLVAQYGGAIILAYAFCLVCFGLPLVIIELGLGQFMGLGPTRCFELAPMSKGVGLAVVLMCSILMIHYNVIMAWIVYYLFTFDSSVHVTSCGHEWNTDRCLAKFIASVDCSPPLVAKSDGTCRDAVGKIVGLFNSSLQDFDFPAHQYFYNRVLGQTKLFSHEGVLNNPNLVPCLLTPLIFVLISLFKWPKLYAWIGCLLLLVKCFLLAFFCYIVFIGEAGSYWWSWAHVNDYNTLLHSHVWVHASIYTFNSLGICLGNLHVMASYNFFDSDLLGDAVVLMIGDFLFSICSVFIVFFFLDVFAVKIGVSIVDIVAKWKDFDFAFVVLPMAMTFENSTYQLNLYFLFLFMLGIDSQMVGFQTITNSILESLPPWYRMRPHFQTALVCLVVFLLGLPMLTDRGLRLHKVVTTFQGNLNYAIISLLEVVTISYIYGARHFVDDIGFMSGQSSMFGLNNWTVLRPVLLMFWWFITPISLFIILINQLIYMVNLVVDNRNPLVGVDWAVIQIHTAVLCCIIGFMIWELYYLGQHVGERRLTFMITPSDKWRPSDLKNTVLYKLYQSRTRPLVEGERDSQKSGDVEEVPSVTGEATGETEQQEEQAGEKLLSTTQVA